MLPMRTEWERCVPLPNILRLFLPVLRDFAARSNEMAAVAPERPHCAAVEGGAARARKFVYVFTKFHLRLLVECAILHPARIFQHRK